MADQCIFFLNYCKVTNKYFSCYSIHYPNYKGRGSPMDRVLDSGSEGPGFDIRFQIKTHRVHCDGRTSKICGSSKSRRCVRMISPKLTVGCQIRCRSRHLTVVLNYEALLAVLKLLTEARNRQPETFIPTTLY